jgi:nicotinamide-nucleotide amidase
MKAEIVNIGDELLIGQVVNTNAAWLGEQLSLAGITVIMTVTIPDSRDAILEALAEAEKRSDLVLITGGLGPTKDDVTKLTLCDYFNTKLVFHQASYENVEKRFHARGLKVKETNRRQAEIPESCTPIMNHNGTAPGMWFEKGSTIYVSLPGVPYELQPMVSDFILPRLRESFKLPVILKKTILTQGIGESWIAETISEWEDSLPGNIKLAYLPQPGLVRIRLTVVGEDKEEAVKELENRVEELIALLPDYFFGYDDETLEEIIGRLLNEEGKTLGTAESCTGGYIAHLITSIPGSSAYFKGSVVAYSNEVKEDILKVRKETLIKYGAVSKETVTEMASGIRNHFRTDYSIAVSGIAGPEGGTEEKPVGTTCIAIASPEKVVARRFLFGDHRGRNIRIAALTALNMLRKQLLNHLIT